MEYITAEQFLEQSKEVQETFIDWWKPGIGDLFKYKEKDEHDCIEVECIQSKNRLRTITFAEVIPLLTEGQLRQFIEDKTRTKIDIEFYTTGYEIFASSDEYHIRTDNLFQAYWQVAIKIASEEVKKSENS